MPKGQSLYAKYAIADSRATKLSEVVDINIKTNFNLKSSFRIDLANILLELIKTNCDLEKRVALLESQQSR